MKASLKLSAHNLRNWSQDFYEQIQFMGLMIPNMGKAASWSKHINLLNNFWVEKLFLSSVAVSHAWPFARDVFVVKVIMAQVEERESFRCECEKATWDFFNFNLFSIKRLLFIDFSKNVFELRGFLLNWNYSYSTRFLTFLDEITCRTSENMFPVVIHVF